MSQQCTLFMFVVEETLVEILSCIFHLGPSINSSAFVNGTSYLVLAWYFEKKA